MQFIRDGAQLFAGALTPNDLDRLEQVLEDVPTDRPGTRLNGNPALSLMLSTGGPIGRLAAFVLGSAVKPVRALLFNKTAAQNWALAWHQDRTIAVRERVDTPGFTNWTVKCGMLHVEPPFAILERMLTLRVHLDRAGPANAPLLIAPGSHRLGRISEPEIASIARRLGTFTCLAARGDVWLYATPLLHASEAAAFPGSRRVLQVDFSVDKMPNGLDWLGV